MFRVMELEVNWPIFTTWGLPVRKSWIQSQSEEFRPRSVSLITSLMGLLNWKLSYSQWKAAWHSCHFFCQCVREECRTLKECTPLNKNVNKPASWSAQDLRTRPVIPSGPAAFLTFTLLSSLRTSSSNTVTTWSSLLCLLLPDALISRVALPPLHSKRP